MATLFLSGAGSVLGTALGGAAGGAVGYTLGAIGGQLIDQKLFNPSNRQTDLDSPRDIHLQTSTYGSPIAQIFGTMRVSGEIIWATTFKKYEVSGQGKGGSASSSESHYKISLAVALGEGEIDSVHRIWFDGQQINQRRVTMRYYKGTQDQLPDSFIVANQVDAPAYRGCAYIVFENLDLSAYGNRLPQMSFEIARATSETLAKVKALTLIPGATEWGYHPNTVLTGLVGSNSEYENRNTGNSITDVRIAIDQLKQACPNCRKISLVVSWFGTSTDAGSCQIVPKVLNANETSLPEDWIVSGVRRNASRVVSRINGKPAFDGTPSDSSVIAIIKYLKAQGFEVMFHPFILADVPSYPWRGRIGTNPADGLSTNKGKINFFFGTGVGKRDFTRDTTNKTVIWNASVRSKVNNDWGYRRFILHYINLCAMAGGVDYFLIGSELRGITRTQTSEGSYYAGVFKLKGLAAHAREYLPNAKISYGANWDEYRGTQPYSSPNDFHYNLDLLWGSSSVDFVGINYYMPLSDWRDEQPNVDGADGTTIYDVNYLRSNINSGEGYDWYYLNKEARKTQNRSLITDGSNNKPWVYRWKDLKSWWSNSHHHRINGTEEQTSTDWVPGSKEIYFTEAGCPAVDKGPNQPNIFSDFTAANSSEGGFPYFSSGKRDDYIQNQFLEAILSAFDPNSAGHLDDFNPVINGKRMLLSDNIFLWCWDARPYPWFPELPLWADGVNWARGHWLNGRASYSNLETTARYLLEGNSFKNFDVSKLNAGVKGFQVSRISEARNILDGLQRFFFFDASERNGKIHFQHRDGVSVADIDAEECVIGENGESGYEILRAQEEELPKSVKLHYIDETNSYRQAVAEARHNSTISSYVAEARLPLVATPDEAYSAAKIWLQETWVARIRVIMRLKPSRLELEPGDIITFRSAAPSRRKYLLRINDIRDEGFRTIEAVQVNPRIYRNSGQGFGARTSSGAQSSPLIARSAAYVPALPTASASLLELTNYLPPSVAMMDLPILRGNEKNGVHIATYAEPRPPRLNVFRSLSGEHSWQIAASIEDAPIMGVLESFPPAPIKEELWDKVNNFRLRMLNGELFSRSSEDVLVGANYAAIKHRNGWEIVQFCSADLIAGDRVGDIYYNVHCLLRGLAGTENEMRSGFDDGAYFVLLEETKLPQIEMAPVQNNVNYHYRIGTSSENYSDISYTALTYNYRAINQRPLSVVHLRAQRNRLGDIQFNWHRRSRDLSQNGWGETEIPLGEVNEAYEIDIYNGEDSFQRTLTSNTQNAIYSNAQQRADFSTQPASTPLKLIVRAYQISATFGRGATRKETIYV